MISYFNLNRKVTPLSSPVLGYVMTDRYRHVICIEMKILLVEECCLREHHTVSARPPNRPPASIPVTFLVFFLHKKLPCLGLN